MSSRDDYETYIVSPLTLILDNFDREHCEALQGAARAAVEEDAGYPDLTLETYRQTYNHGDTSEFQAVVGSAVAELLGEWLDSDGVPELWRTILTDILDLHTREVRDLLGYHYLPEPSDMEGILASDDDDDEAGE